MNGGGSVLADAAHFAVRQYVPHSSSQVRPNDGHIDIGAFEYASGAGAGCDAASESSPAAAWVIGGLFGFVLTRRRRPGSSAPLS
ncbi:MAG TPA: MYXO-CTERM sorting domain-containing protein [Polyangiaceae bacterium]|nr:MYXO-CTERM sorting domain-containing protein [Polyangiaceae bacterium]